MNPLLILHSEKFTWRIHTFRHYGNFGKTMYVFLTIFLNKLFCQNNLPLNVLYHTIHNTVSFISDADMHMMLTPLHMSNVKARLKDESQINTTALVGYHNY